MKENNFRPIRIGKKMWQDKHTGLVIFYLHEEEYDGDGITNLRVDDVVIISSKFMNLGIIGGVLIDYVSPTADNTCCGAFVYDFLKLKQSPPKEYYFQVTTLDDYKRRFIQQLKQTI